MLFKQIRHATCIIEFEGTRFLVDPILYKKNTLDGVKGGIDKKNPLVDISVSDEVIKNIDVILLTHTHKDHFDPSIIEYFGKDVPIVCCCEYEKQLSELGFSNLKLIKDSIEIGNIEVILVKGQHGTGIVGKMMGNSYGFILECKHKDTLYITGDTVWCKCVEKAIDEYSPQYIVAFAGSAMIEGKHITMNADDINKMLNKASNAKIISIHMEAWNHCLLSRNDLENACKNKNLYIPADGEELNFL